MEIIEAGTLLKGRLSMGYFSLFFKFLSKRLVRIRKRQVTHGIFHGIPLEALRN